MFGKWVTVNLGEGVKCEVFVLCVPSTPDDVLQARSYAVLASRITPRAADVAKASAERALQSANEAAQMLGVGKPLRK